MLFYINTRPTINIKDVTNDPVVVIDINSITDDSKADLPEVNSSTLGENDVDATRP